MDAATAIAFVVVCLTFTFMYGILHGDAVYHRTENRLLRQRIRRMERGTEATLLMPEVDA